MGLEKLENIKLDTRKGNSQFSGEEKKIIKSLYNKYVGEKKQFNSNCNSCYVDAFIQLTLLNKNNMEERKFILKEGTLIQSFDIEKMYNNSNMSDEDAVRLLRKSPAYLKHFKKYPENWMELCGNVQEQPSIEIDTTVADVKMESESVVENSVKTTNEEQVKPFKKKNKKW
jgi:hypothetical protein